MQIFAQTEPTAARRQILFKLVDRTDNLTPELGINLVTLLGAMEVVKSDDSSAGASGTVIEIDGGFYRYEFTSAEFGLTGPLLLLVDTAAAAIVHIQSQVRSLLNVYGHLYDGAVNVADYGIVGVPAVGVDGTLDSPIKAGANVRTLSDTLKTRKIRYLDNEIHVLDAVSWDGYQFEGDGNALATVTVDGGTSFNGASFKNLIVQGEFPGGVDVVYFENVGLQNEVGLPLIAVFLRCGLSDFFFYTGGVAIFRDCFDSVTPGNPFVLCIDGNAIATTIEFRRFAGQMRIDLMTAGGAIDINLNSGTVTVDATCTNGSIKVYGTGRVINNSALVIDTSELIDSESLAILRAHKDAYVLDGGPGAANVVLDAEGLLLTGRVRAFRAPAEAAAATKGAANGADGEIFAGDVTGVNTGVAGALANMETVGQ